MEEFNKYDPNYNKSLFITKVANIFIRYYTSITLFEVDNIKHFLTEKAYNNASSYVNNCKLEGYRHVYENISVNNIILYKSEVLDEYLHNVVILDVELYDYKMSLKDNSIIEGDNRNKIKRQYTVDFVKWKYAGDQDAVRRCSSCGHSLDVNNIGKCPYCGSVYKLKFYDWLLDDVRFSNISISVRY